MPGSLEKRGKNSWRITVSDGYDETGNKRRITRTCKFADDMTETAQRKECERIAATLFTDASRGNVVGSRQYTVKEFAEMWIQDYPTTAGLSPVTVEGYRGLLEGRIYSSLGHIKLSQLSPQQITRFYNKLLTENCKNNGRTGKPLTASTVLHYHRVLRAMLNTAVRWGIIANNPALKANVPKNDARRMKVYDPTQSNALLSKLEEAPLKHRTGISLALFCQMRLGEIGGLDWHDINFENATLNIERSAACLVGGGVILKPPKTEAGRRTISIPQQALTLLRRLKAEQAADRLKLGDTWQDSGAVFVQWNGHRQYPKTFSSWFQKFLKRHDLPKIRFHDLRHTGASLLLNIMDMPMHIVTDRLGHSDPTITMRFYSHGFEQKDRAAAAGLDALLGPQKSAK